MTRKIGIRSARTALSNGSDGLVDGVCVCVWGDVNAVENAIKRNVNVNRKERQVLYRVFLRFVFGWLASGFLIGLGVATFIGFCIWFASLKNNQQAK